MNDIPPDRQLAEAQETIRALEEELDKTNAGLLALTLELEQRVDDRTAELRAAHEELERTNSELLALTLELEQRVAQRTAEVQEKSEQLAAMTQQLWQVAKLATVGELAASIAHELNNPLGILSLRVESLLEQTPEEDPRRRSLQIIEAEIERMAGLVAHLLQFSRRSSFQPSSVDLKDEIQSALRLIQHQFRTRGIRVEDQYDPELPIIQADRQLLRQLFLNLLTNASDAMPSGGTLAIRAEPALLGNGIRAAAVEFADTGMGIPDEVLPRVFEPFFTTKEEGRGTGLGLAICRRITQEHHGTLEIQSRVGQGTTVRVVLPLSPRERHPPSD